MVAPLSLRAAQFAVALRKRDGRFLSQAMTGAFFMSLRGKQPRELDHPYSLMTADICPVGALTNRDFRFKERYRLSLRLDALNVLNHSFPGGPQLAPTNSQFGQITAAAANLNRFIQIQGHIRW